MKKNKMMKLLLMAKKIDNNNIPILPKMLTLLNRIVFSCDVPYTANVSETVVFGHNGLATVVHPKAKIGNGTLVMQQVVIGGNMGKYRVVNGERITCPYIGDNVMIGVGAKLLGPIQIGNNVQIGAGSIVLNDIPENCIAVGSPAKVIRKMDSNEIKSIL